jgi:hypothetical protein
MAWLGRAVRTSRRPRAMVPNPGMPGSTTSCTQGQIAHPAPEPTASGSLAAPGPITIGPGRSGRYAVTDAAGHPIGRVFGDYVIGFTITCWDLKWTVPDLEDAWVSLQLEAEARALNSVDATA